jgi:hypothetical protein
MKTRTRHAPGNGLMIDNFALVLSHGLLLFAAWRLMWRPDLDDDTAPASPQRVPWRRDPASEDQPGA